MYRITPKAVVYGSMVNRKEELPDPIFDTARCINGRNDLRKAMGVALSDERECAPRLRMVIFNSY
jgi:hypothetical protein